MLLVVRHLLLLAMPFVASFLLLVMHVLPMRGMTHLRQLVNSDPSVLRGIESASIDALGKPKLFPAFRGLKLPHTPWRIRVFVAFSRWQGRGGS